MEVSRRRAAKRSAEAASCVGGLGESSIVEFVGDDALGFLQQLPVATLDLSWTQVGDGGAAALARCPSLTSLK